MSVKLTPSELAALDMLIKHMEENDIEDAFSPDAWVAAVAKAAVKVAAKAAVAEAATQAVKAIVGGGALDPELVKNAAFDEMDETITLSKLKEIQRDLS